MVAEVLLAQALRDTKLTKQWKAGKLDGAQTASILESLVRNARYWYRREATSFAILYLGYEEGRSLEEYVEVSRIAGIDLAAHARRFFGRMKVYIRESIVAGVMALAGNRPITGGELSDIDRAVAVQEAYLGKFEGKFIQVPPALRPEKTHEIIVIAPPMTVAQFIANAEMYGAAPWAAGNNIHRAYEARQGIYSMERRILGTENNCSECPEIADLGWQPLGSLPDIGTQECKINCRCRFQFK